MVGCREVDRVLEEEEEGAWVESEGIWVKMILQALPSPFSEF